MPCRQRLCCLFERPHYSHSKCSEPFISRSMCAHCGLRRRVRSAQTCFVDCLQLPVNTFPRLFPLIFCAGLFVCRLCANSRANSITLQLHVFGTCATALFEAHGALELVYLYPSSSIKVSYYTQRVESKTAKISRPIGQLLVCWYINECTPAVMCILRMASSILYVYSTIHN